MENPKELLQFSSKRSITNLYKNLLKIIEDLKLSHDSTFAKLEERYPELGTILEFSQFLDDAKFSNIRKRILDIGNETSREVSQQIEQFEVRY